MVCGVFGQLFWFILGHGCREWIWKIDIRGRMHWKLALCKYHDDNTMLGNVPTGLPWTINKTAQQSNANTNICFISETHKDAVNRWYGVGWKF